MTCGPCREVVLTNRSRPGKPTALLIFWNAFCRLKPRIVEDVEPNVERPKRSLSRRGMRCMPCGAHSTARQGGTVPRSSLLGREYRGPFWTKDGYIWYMNLYDLYGSIWDIISDRVTRVKSRGSFWTNAEYDWGHCWGLSFEKGCKWI